MPECGSAPQDFPHLRWGFLGSSVCAACERSVWVNQSVGSVVRGVLLSLVVVRRMLCRSRGVLVQLASSVLFVRVDGCGVVNVE